ncbi:Aste57867_10026 [Aphanomyces stellatus]|uniref:Aste57867_10026 protein n=1 Tax=Aphanomyces stellatus TaxID=120398 RepID=A0A485KPC0_9STRA|nr:hypothetical protein As57867_009987 [Aphanomyces stellatus]VFT86904.1 Aste57867_10026 [Aphanomyces stellatus]
MGGTAVETKAFAVEAARKRLKELAKETNVEVAEGSGVNVVLTDLRLGDTWSSHVRVGIEWNAATLLQLDLSFNKFSDGMAQALGDLPALPMLQSLNLSSNNFVDTSSELIVRVLVKAPSLASLDLSLNHFGKSCAKHLAAYVPAAKALTALNLSSNKLHDDGCEVFCHALATRRSTLQSLALSLNGLTDAGAVAVATMLANASVLARLVLSGNHIGDYGAGALAFSIDRCAFMQDVRLDSNAISSAGILVFFNILRSNPTKTYAQLCLDDNPADPSLLAQVALKRRAMVLRAAFPDAPADGRLDLDGTHVVDRVGCVIDDGLSKTAMQILRAWTHLVDVTLSGNAIGDTGAMDIGFYLALNPRLTRLSLAHNVITDDGALGLAKGLLVNCTLAHLNLTSNLLGDRGVAAIFATSFDNKKSALAAIHVHGNRQSSEGDAVVHAIVQSKALEAQLRAAPAPPVLDLSGMHLRRFGADVLCDVLATDVTCQVLNLCRNTLGDDGACSIAALLRTNVTLTKVDLSCNGIGDAGAAAIADVLRVNSTLTMLNLRAAYGANYSSVVVSEAGMLHLSEALRENKGLQVVDVRDHVMTKRVVASWVHVLQANGCIQKFNGTAPAPFLARMRDKKGRLD